MEGHHKVRMFALPRFGEERKLPDNWKPFAAAVINGNSVILARKWFRSDSA